MSADLESFAPVVDMDLDPGIRRAVLILRRGGVETYESCDGGDGHAFQEPTIRFYGTVWAGYHAFSVAMEHGLPVLHLRLCYGVVDGHLQGPNWEMTFRPEVLELEAKADVAQQRRSAPSRATAGGHARAAVLSPERRSEIARAAANARWAERGQRHED